jgi:cob(I)alamin adenosyltransferase
VMRLYTGTGDDGTTGLFGGGRVPKDNPRVVAYGEADGLNGSLGFAAAHCQPGEELSEVLAELQHLVFRLGADLATPPASTHEDKVRRIKEGDVATLEGHIDRIDGANEDLKVFVLPGGCELAARLHLARDAARRCERAMVTLLSSPTACPQPRCSGSTAAVTCSLPWRGQPIDLQVCLMCHGGVPDRDTRFSLECGSFLALVHH